MSLTRLSKKRQKYYPPNYAPVAILTVSRATLFSLYQLALFTGRIKRRSRT